VVVLEVLDGHVERVPAPVEVRHHGVAAPVAVGVDHVAAIAVGQQIRVVVIVGRPLTGPGADTHGFAELPLGGSRAGIGH
jgi:hypothetical protein